MKPFATTLDPRSSLANHTGTWRTRRPLYVERDAPCHGACPAGEEPRGWLALARAGEHRAAWERLVAQNPFPAVMGRACYHPCTSACHRGEVDLPVAIPAVERFLGDLALREGWPLPIPTVAPSGKRVLVIGGGPSGLAAAYHLVRRGHAVTLREAAPRLGGMLRYGIPAYRLPRDVLDGEIARITALGITVETGARVADAGAALAEGFDACFAAIGAHLANRTGVPAGDAGHVFDALALFAGLEDGAPPRLGRRVVVYGGGNTALDAARTAKRLGAVETCIVYRRTREAMPAHDFEVREALDEGITMRWLRTIGEVEDGQITVERMELDAAGTPRPTGEHETLAADSVVLAIGQNVDLGVLERVPGVRVADRVVAVDERLMTGHPGLFAGGDMVPGERSVAIAIGHGARAAASIDAWLAGRALPAPEPREVAALAAMNLAYTERSPAAEGTTVPVAVRLGSFTEVHAGLDEPTARAEAERCLSCGHCFACDNCYGMCPDNAIQKREGGAYAIALDYCKGCGICASECPCGAITMEDVGG